MPIIRRRFQKIKEDDEGQGGFLGAGSSMVNDVHNFPAAPVPLKQKEDPNSQQQYPSFSDWNAFETNSAKGHKPKETEIAFNLPKTQRQGVGGKPQLSEGIAEPPPLLRQEEDPNRQQHYTTLSDWNAFETSSAKGNKPKETETVFNWPKMQTQEMGCKPQLLERSTKESKPVRVPQIKASRYDDFRHNRAKELLHEVRRGKKDYPFGQAIDETDTKASVSSKVSQSSTDQRDEDALKESNEFGDWNTFGQDTIPNATPWESFGSMPAAPWGNTSPVAADIFPIGNTVHKPRRRNKERPNDGNSPISQGEVSMPGTLNLENVLEQPAETAENEVNSEGISIKESEEDDNIEVFLKISDVKEEGKESNSDKEDAVDLSHNRISTAVEESSGSFSLGLDTIEDVLDGNKREQCENRNTNKRQSLYYQRKELLSPATAPASTPKEMSTERAAHSVNVTSTTKQRKEAMDQIAEADTTLGEGRNDSYGLQESTSLGYHAPVEATGEAENVAAKLKHENGKHHVMAPRRKSGMPTSLNATNQKSNFYSAREKIKLLRSIHFPREQAKITGNSSLLDTDSEVSDSVGGLYSEAVSSGSAHTQGDRINFLVDTSSFNSELISAMTYPVTMKRSADSEDTSTGDRKTRRHMRQHPNSKCPRKSKAKPLGASSHEIKMLNTFLHAVGPKIRNSNLSTEDREEIHNRAIKANLPEEFVNKMLDQTAGIIRWEEHSIGTMLTSDSTDVSSHCRHSVHSSDSQSTRYTRDTESISYHTYGKMGRTPKEADRGKYGCFSELASAFWVETGLSGDDMMESVAAAISESFDDSSRRPRRRRRRRTVW